MGFRSLNLQTFTDAKAQRLYSQKYRRISFGIVIFAENNLYSTFEKKYKLVTLPEIQK